MVNGTQQCCVLGKRRKYIPGCIFMKLAYEPYAVNVLYASCTKVLGAALQQKHRSVGWNVQQNKKNGQR